MKKLNDLVIGSDREGKFNEKYVYIAIKTEKPMQI